jgi:hypothetical protein
MAGGGAGRLQRAIWAKPSLDDYFPTIFQENYEHVVEAAGTGLRITVNPSNATTELAVFDPLVRRCRRYSSSMSCRCALMSSARRWSWVLPMCKHSPNSTLLCNPSLSHS